MLLKNSPKDSAFVRSVSGDDSGWSVTDHLLALVVDHLAIAQWQRGGGKGPLPKPLKRPGTENERHGTASMSLEELKAWRDKRRGR